MAGGAREDRARRQDRARRGRAHQRGGRGHALSGGRQLALVLAAVAALGCPRREPPPAPEPAQPLLAESPLAPTGGAQFEIDRLDWTRSDDGKQLYVEGIVRNTGTRASRDLKVWVDGLDAGGQRLARAEAFPSPQAIPPGGAGRFVVRFPNDDAIRTFKVEAIGR